MNRRYQKELEDIELVQHPWSGEARRTEAIDSTALHTIVHTSRQRVYERFWVRLINNMSRLAIHNYMSMHELPWVPLAALAAAWH